MSCEPKTQFELHEREYWARMKAKGRYRIVVSWGVCKLSMAAERQTDG